MFCLVYEDIQWFSFTAATARSTLSSPRMDHHHHHGRRKKGNGEITGEEAGLHYTVFLYALLIFSFHYMPTPIRSLSRSFPPFPAEVHYFFWK